MKGALGLTLAAGFGIIGALSNWFYLDRLAKTEEKVYFIAIEKGATLNPGDTIKKGDLTKVGIPRSRVDYLDSVAPQWSAVESVRGVKANRAMRGGDIILNLDLMGTPYNTMAASLLENEVLRWVSINSGAVVPGHINPGDYVSFDVPRIGGGVPTPAGSRTGSRSSSGTSEIIGPFRVGALGERREPDYVWEGGRRTSGSEGRIAIICTVDEDGQLDAMARRLFEAIRLSGGQDVQVQLHSSRAIERKKTSTPPE